MSEPAANLLAIEHIKAAVREIDSALDLTLQVRREDCGLLADALCEAISMIASVGVKLRGDGTP